MPKVCQKCRGRTSFYDNHDSCFLCSGCSSMNPCRVCSAWSIEQWESTTKRYKTPATCTEDTISVMTSMSDFVEREHRPKPTAPTATVTSATRTETLPRPPLTSSLDGRDVSNQPQPTPTLDGRGKRQETSPPSPRDGQEIRRQSLPILPLDGHDLGTERVPNAPHDGHGNRHQPPPISPHDGQEIRHKQHPSSSRDRRESHTPPPDVRERRSRSISRRRSRSPPRRRKETSPRSPVSKKRAASQNRHSDFKRARSFEEYESDRASSYSEVFSDVTDWRGRTPTSSRAGSALTTQPNSDLSTKTLTLAMEACKAEIVRFIPQRAIGKSGGKKKKRLRVRAAVDDDGEEQETAFPQSLKVEETLKEVNEFVDSRSFNLDSYLPNSLSSVKFKKTWYDTPEGLFDPALPKMEREMDVMGIKAPPKWTAIPTKVVENLESMLRNLVMMNSFQDLASIAIVSILEKQESMLANATSVDRIARGINRTALASLSAAVQTASTLQLVRRDACLKRLEVSGAVKLALKCN